MQDNLWKMHLEKLAGADFKGFYVMPNLKVVEHNPVTMYLNFSND